MDHRNFAISRDIDFGLKSVSAIPNARLFQIERVSMIGNVISQRVPGVVSILKLHKVFVNFLTRKRIQRTVWDQSINVIEPISFLTR